MESTIRHQKSTAVFFLIAPVREGSKGRGSNWKPLGFEPGKFVTPLPEKSHNFGVQRGVEVFFFISLEVKPTNSQKNSPP